MTLALELAKNTFYLRVEVCVISDRRVTSAGLSGMRSAVDSGGVPSAEVRKLLIVEPLVVGGQAGCTLTLLLKGLMCCYFRA
jgi:hypothetical protein